MNVSIPRPRNPGPRTVLAPVRPDPRQRATGVGYGTSSGYFRRASYAPSTMSTRFRVS